MGSKKLLGAIRNGTMGSKKLLGAIPSGTMGLQMHFGAICDDRGVRTTLAVEALAVFAMT